jgi:hypothetical protein
MIEEILNIVMQQDTWLAIEVFLAAYVAFTLLYIFDLLD